MAFAEFVSDTVVAGDVAAQQKQSGPSALPAYMTPLVALQHQAATDLLYTRLLARGYTVAQIAGWDLGAEVERQVALYLCLVAAGMLEAADPHLLEKYETYTLPEKGLLDTVLLTVGGVWQAPGDTPGTVASGNVCEHPRHWDADAFGFRW